MSADEAARIRLRRGRDRRVRAGHLWIYGGEIEDVSKGVAPGDPVEVLDARGRFLARAYYNPRSSIAARILTRRRNEEVGAPLLRRRIARALAYRRTFQAAGEPARLVFSEGDGLPGLIVDRYGSYLIVQISTLGMDRLRDAIVDALMDALHPRGIYERSDLSVRAREGLETRTGVLAGEVPETTEVTMDGLRFLVPLTGGQKTGMFLDHRLNRIALQRYARGRRALDVFCNTGSFALYGMAAGAVSALGIEISSEGVRLAMENADRNSLATGCTWIEANAFDVLRDLDRGGDRFDLIVLDPPAFTKRSDAVDAARRGYKEINLRALRLASHGAVILTSSCSSHIGAEAFLDIVREAATDARRETVLIELRGQAPDHPVVLQVPETQYLKCAVLHVR